MKQCGWRAPGSDQPTADSVPEVGSADPGCSVTGYPDTLDPDTGYPDNSDTGYPDTGYPDTGYPDQTGFSDTGYPDPEFLDADFPADEQVALTLRRSLGGPPSSSAFPNPVRGTGTLPGANTSRPLGDRASGPAAATLGAPPGEETWPVAGGAGWDVESQASLSDSTHLRTRIKLTDLWRLMLRPS